MCNRQGWASALTLSVPPLLYLVYLLAISRTANLGTWCCCAGHSLGGALATLAAHDLQAEFRFQHLHCYTFGAPRTGNHAFAAESSRLVPETWHIINDRALQFAHLALEPLFC